MVSYKVHDQTKKEDSGPALLCRSAVTLPKVVYSAGSKRPMHSNRTVPAGRFSRT